MPESLPYGLRDIKVATLTSAGVKGASVDLPVARTLSFEEAEEFQTLRGDDKVRATRGSGPSVEWDLEAGGICLEALVVINGGTLTITGTGATVVRKYQKKATDARPEFYTEGQALSEAGGDVHAVLYRCKSTGGVSGEFADGAFYVQAASGEAYPSLATGSLDALYDIVENTTTTAIA